jgi:hypothetical protein
VTYVSERWTAEARAALEAEVRLRGADMCPSCGGVFAVEEYDNALRLVAHTAEQYQYRVQSAVRPCGGSGARVVPL